MLIINKPLIEFINYCLLLIKMFSFIAISILISFVAFKIYRSIRVPEGLKNVPALSFFNVLIATITKAGPDKRWEDTRKVLEKEGIGRVIFFHTF